MSKLGKLMEIEGYDSLEEMLEEATFGDNCMGICMNPNCDYTISTDPDATNNWCEECQTNTVKSCLILAGVI